MKKFLRDGARQDCSAKYLSEVSLQYIDSHPRKGLAWGYSFSF
jgi:hypothetical protein